MLEKILTERYYLDRIRRCKINDLATTVSSVSSDIMLTLVRKIICSEVSCCSITYSIRIPTASSDGDVLSPKVIEAIVSMKKVLQSW